MSRDGREESSLEPRAVSSGAPGVPLASAAQPVLSLRAVPVSGPHEPAGSALRISASGILLGGDAPPELIDGVAYAALLADTAGDLMGVDAFASIEITLSNGSCVIARDPGGDLIALTGGPGIAAAEIRRALGLDG